MNLSNTSTRIIVSVIAIPILLLLAYLGEIFFVLFVLLISSASYLELSLMAKKKGANPNLIWGVIGVLIIIYNHYEHYIDVKLILILWFIILLLLELFSKKQSPILNIGTSLLGLVYFGFFGSSLVGIREFYPQLGDLYLRGGWMIISIFATIWICDSAAFFGGKALGKHKLFSRVSPKKTWEGAIFGFVFAIATMILAQQTVLSFIIINSAIVIGIIIGLFGQIGDLVESLLKRDAEVKDSSFLIPGHGGIFDRFDSLFFTSPLIYIYLIYFG